jgi:putative membrane-bound dehydrogenase-like protein
MRYITLLAVICTGAVEARAEIPLPKVADGWKAELVVEAPKILFPTAVVVAGDGAIYVGQDPMDMPGPPTEPIDSVVRIKGGKASVFAEKLWAVMGLEWAGDTLYVVHAPFLSAFRDINGDGKADQRVDLVTGLGPKLPGFSGINDHVASGVRLGVDGFLYISVGDKGIPKAVGKDGATISLFGGGVIRVRPDGTGLEIVSMGERNPLSTMLTATDDVFTYGNDDDSKRWPNSLTHHIFGANFGYPYHFQSADGRPISLPGGLKIRSPRRCLPITGGQLGGSGTQGVCYLEPGAPQRYQGNLFVTDWGLGAVFRYVMEPAGATFKVKSREEFLSAGSVQDFRPFSVAVSPVDGSLIVVDWAFTGWLADGPKTGRIYRVSYVGKDKPTFKHPAPSNNSQTLIGRLDDPSRTVRLDSERALTIQGAKAVPSLTARLQKPGRSPGRVPALWTLQRIGGVEAQEAITKALTDADPTLRAQAARALGVKPAGFAFGSLVPLLKDKEPTVRREAAIALGRRGDTHAADALYAAMGDPDVFVSWSVRRAIHALKAWDRDRLVAALTDPKRRNDALDLTDETWSVPVVEALNETLTKTKDPATRVRIVANLAGLYRKYPAWSGHWFGTNPLIGELPKRSVDWSPEGMGLVQAGLTKAVADPEAIVRREAIAGLRQLPPASYSRILQARLALEHDPSNLVAISDALAASGDRTAIGALARVLLDPKQPVRVRVAAEDATSALPSGARSRRGCRSSTTRRLPPHSPPGRS